MSNVPILDLAGEASIDIGAPFLLVLDIIDPDINLATSGFDSQIRKFRVSELLRSEFQISADPVARTLSLFLPWQETAKFTPGFYEWDILANYYDLNELGVLSESWSEYLVAGRLEAIARTTRRPVLPALLP